MIELVICVSIVGLLLALILPAVQQARESARRIECSSRLRQLSLAMHSIHQAQDHFPGPSDDLYMELLDHLEQHALREAMEEMWSEGRFTPGLGHVSVFACPSNTVDFDNYEHSYVRSNGVLWRDPHHILQVISSPSDGMARYEFGTTRPVKLRHVTDGTSNTTLFSETRPWNFDFLVPIGQEKPFDPSRVYFRKAEREPTGPRDLAKLCLTATERAEFFGDNHQCGGRSTYTHLGPRISHRVIGIPRSISKFMEKTRRQASRRQVFTPEECLPRLSMAA